MTASLRGFKHTEETKQKIRATRLGKKHTPAARAKMSASVRANPKSGRPALSESERIRHRQITFEKNLPKRRETTKKYRQAHKETMQEQTRQWVRKHPARRRAIALKSFHKNKKRHAN